VITYKERNRFVLKVNGINNDCYEEK
jgi:hypothetical protein